MHQGDKFFDGAVRSVNPQGLVIVQEVRDPLSLVKQREIRKQLRSAEGAAAAPVVPTGTQRIASETSGNAADFTNAIMPP